MPKIYKLLRRIERLFLWFLSPKAIARYFRYKGEVKIGVNCVIFRTVSFGAEPYLVTIGDNVKISDEVIFSNHDGAIWVLRNLGLVDEGSDVFGRIEIGNNVFIGVRSIILPNVSIGDNVVIGAGSIVTHDIPSNVVAAGVPAKVIKTIDEYAAKEKERCVSIKHLNYKDKKLFLERS